MIVVTTDPAGRCVRARMNGLPTPGKTTAVSRAEQAAVRRRRSRRLYARRDDAAMFAPLAAAQPRSAGPYHG